MLKQNTNNTDLTTLTVRPIRSSERNEWDQLMATNHYLGFKQLVGESIRYVALLGQKWVALLGWSSAAFKSTPREKWIGWSDKQRMTRLKYVANNSRFLILPNVQIKNLASKALALNLNRLSSDWLEVHEHPIFLAETFIDQSRFTGTCYRAAGFIPLGQTQGYGRSAGRYYMHGKIKTILIRPLKRKTRQWLSAPFFSPALFLGRKYPALVDLNRLTIDGSGGLLEHLSTVTDSRKLHGIRHSHIAVLAIVVCASLSGSDSYMEVGRWAEKLDQIILHRFGCRIGQKRKGYEAPGEATLRRAIQSVNIGDLSQAVTLWLSTHGQERVATKAVKRLNDLRLKSHKADVSVPVTKQCLQNDSKLFVEEGLLS